jgi:CDP-glycerol glycerophosphotransferase (TagB/SpsB family)
MLFSIVIGAATTVYFLARALLIKLKGFSSRGRFDAEVKNLHPYVIYCEGKQYWNVFKPVLDEFEKRKKELLYLTSSMDDPVFETSYQYVKTEYIGEGNKAFSRLNFLAADIVLMTTPGLQVYQLKRSKTVKHYAHVLHMPNDATTYHMFGIDYFDSILLTGDYQKHDIRSLERLRGLPAKKLITVGCTYLDVYNEKIHQLPKEEDAPFTVLVSPTWGPAGLLARYGENLLDPLVNTGWRIIIRPHPQSIKSEFAILKRLSNNYNNTPNLIWDYGRENIISLAKADIMISDFSGIIFDYAFLMDKPFLYANTGIDLTPYDADDLKNELWQFKAIREMGIELKEEYFRTISGLITEAKDNDDLKKARHEAKDIAWQHRGEAGKLIADFMLNEA